MIIPWGKKGLSYSLGQLKSFLLKDRVNPRGKIGCSPMQLKFFLLKDMIVPLGKKCLNCSSRQLKLFFLKDMIISQGNICVESFCNHNHFMFVLLEMFQ